MSKRRKFTQFCGNEALQTRGKKCVIVLTTDSIGGKDNLRLTLLNEALSVTARADTCGSEKPKC